ncbi:hypothetical protein ACIHCQ_22605 [Streptomyces sp. NPDC052236]|uniref:hypothetical protein n=1 Tax=Streptomyces sp. NPDC052236 TaxID=3365686 RepID=UPI0037D88FC3
MNTPSPSRLLGALWDRARGRTPEGAQPTAAFLRRRMIVLPALAVIALSLSTAAYGDIHSRTERVRDRCAPALADLAEARIALELAHSQAELRLKKSKNVELGERYSSLLTKAAQSLNQVAQTGALDKAEEQKLRVVSGLVVAYDDKIAWAARHRNTDGKSSGPSELLRNAGIGYAEGILRRRPGTTTPDNPTTILDRINELESDLHDEARDLAALSPLSLAGATAAALSAVLFAFVLLGTCVFLRDRLRLISLQLALAAVPVLLTPVLLAVGGAQEHAAQERVRKVVGKLKQVRENPKALGRIETTARGAADEMRAAHPGGWSLTAGITVPVGGVGAVVCGVTLFVYARPYPAVRTARKYVDNS